MSNKIMDMNSMGEDETSPIWVSEFDANAAKEFCNALFRASDKDPVKPIVVYINSGGGEVSGLLTMMSAMDSVPNDIVTVAMGFAMSAGALLLAHGTVRFASPHAQIMIHKIQAGAMGSLDDIVNESEMLVNLNDYVMGVLAKDCKTTKTEIESALSGRKREVYMSPEEALKFKLVDFVGVPVVTPALPQDRPPYQIAILGSAPPEAPKKPAKKAKKK